MRRGLVSLHDAVEAAVCGTGIGTGLGVQAIAGREHQAEALGGRRVVG